MEAPLTILYTANLRGDLDLLPRLYTFIRRLKSQPIPHEDDVMLCIIEPIVPRILLLDLGDSCAPQVWHCQVTGGRSTLIVLDAMGYAAANVSGFLTEEGRAKLSGMVRLGLVDSAHPWQPEKRDFVVELSDRRVDDSRLHIVLESAANTHLEGCRLQLASVQAGEVGVAQLGPTPDSTLALRVSDILTLPPGTLPDPTIAATVDFVLSEARQFQRKQAQ